MDTSKYVMKHNINMSTHLYLIAERLQTCHDQKCPTVDQTFSWRYVDCHTHSLEPLFKTGQQVPAHSPKIALLVSKQMRNEYRSYSTNLLC